MAMVHGDSFIRSQQVTILSSNPWWSRIYTIAVQLVMCQFATSNCYSEPPLLCHNALSASECSVSRLQAPVLMAADSVTRLDHIVAGLGHPEEILHVCGEHRQ